MNIVNLQAAVAYLSTIPAAEWNLDFFYDPNCRKGCALGHLAVGRQLGLEMGRTWPELQTENGEHFGIDASNVIFGICTDESVYMFGTRTNFEKNLGLPSDKAIFMRRVERYLASQGMDPALMYGPEQTEPTGPSDERDSEHPHHEFA